MEKNERNVQRLRRGEIFRWGERNRDELEKEEDEREEEIAKKTRRSRKRWRRKIGRLNIFDELFHEYAMHEQQVAYETPRGSETGRKTKKHS